MVKHVFLEGEQQTVDFGRQLAQGVLALDEGLTVYLEGTLGAGKTTFCRGVLNALGHSAAVKSPTYTLVEPYEDLRLAVYHFDLYRLADPEELEFMGIRDYFSKYALRLIEWPERGAGILPAADVSLSFSVSGSGRRVQLDASSEQGRRLIAILG